MHKTVNRQNSESQNGERRKSIRQADFWPVFLKTHFANLGAQKRYLLFSIKVGSEGDLSLPFLPKVYKNRPSGTLQWIYLLFPAQNRQWRKIFTLRPTKQVQRL